MPWRSAIGWLAAILLIFTGLEVIFLGGSRLGQLTGSIYWLGMGGVIVGFLACIIFAVWIADRFAMM